MDNAALIAIEPAVQDFTGTLTVSGVGVGYTLTVHSTAGGGRDFTLTRAANGAKTRTCAPNGGSCVGGTWGQ
jgi:hypothetical protein